ncbi:MAG: class I SAM-dependent methyltransferase [Proteobacteria bacterium]|nr:class I SAM-dependent methyltransferase [Pseudomonadota bacterium]
MPMHVNYAYLLYKARELSPGGPVLDYGCGAGEVVEAGVSRGLDVWGADSFFCGDPGAARKKGLLGDRVREIKDGRIPFETETFSLVVSNQVFEHVEDLSRVLSEIHRVLAPSGRLLTLFPDRGVIREGHYGIPGSHWMPRGSRARYWWMLAGRSMGLGALKGEKPRSVWAREAADYLDRAVFHRSRREIRALMEPLFDSRFIEDDYCAFRLTRQGHPRLARAARLPVARQAGNELFRRLSGLVILAKKK